MNRTRQRLYIYGDEAIMGCFATDRECPHIEECPNHDHAEPEVVDSGNTPIVKCEQYSDSVVFYCTKGLSEETGQANVTHISDLPKDILEQYLD